MLYKVVLSFLCLFFFYCFCLNQRIRKSFHSLKPTNLQKHLIFTHQIEFTMQLIQYFRRINHKFGFFMVRTSLTAISIMIAWVITKYDCWVVNLYDVWTLNIIYIYAFSTNHCRSRWLSCQVVGSESSWWCWQAQIVIQVRVDSTQTQLTTDTNWI